MPLRIIKGPPNSGRTELLREEYVRSLRRDPVLVVPSTDDIFTWEERLTREAGAFLGGRVMHFRDLATAILADGQGSGKPEPAGVELASPLRRRTMARNALVESWPLLAGRLEDQPGLIDASLRLIDELRENLVDPETLDQRIADSDGRVPAELGVMYRSWLGKLAASSLEDLPQLAARAATAPVERWEGRPVFVAGFDDLTGQQLTLLSRLAGVTDVTIAITHEPGNRAMAVTERLLGRLEAAGGEVVRETSRPASPEDHDPALFAVERHLLDRGADASLDPADSVTFMQSSGKRGEAEHVGAAIARLVAEGTSPEEIAIAVDSPAENGTIFRDVLATYDLPATLEAETPAAGSAVGQAVLNLLAAASPAGTVGDLFAFARGPVGVDRTVVDTIERDVRREGVTDVEEVAGRFRLTGTVGELPGWDEIMAGQVTSAARSVAARAARHLVEKDSGIVADAVATETAMTTAIIDVCDELERLADEKASAGDLRELLLSGIVKTWAIPAAGTITIASPYSLRAKRFEHLFIVGLQERSLGDDGGGPFLTAAQRGSLGLPEMTDAEDQDLYLFYSSLSIPTRTLTLSTRTSDVHGQLEFPSPMIGEVRRLFRNPERMTVRRTSSEIVFSPANAPSTDELARSVAAGGATPAGIDTSIAARLEQASAVDDLTRTFGPLESDRVLAHLREDSVFSATALEAFIDCPYKWFFERALKPSRFGPEPEALARGNLVHDVLAALYSRHPGQIPTRETVHDWVSEAARLTIDAAGSEKIRLGTSSAEHRIERQRVMAEISRFLFRESRRPDGGFRPAHLEGSFGIPDSGDDPDASGMLPPLLFDEWAVRGRIDRIEVSADGTEAAVFDYKSGTSSCRSLAEMRREGKVQLHLYVRAVEEVWGFGSAVAGLYLPLCRGNGRPRGLLSTSGAAALAELDVYGTDVADDFEAEIQRGVDLAGDAAKAILRGAIDHRQGACLNHLHHAGVPDWKLSTENGENDR